MRSTAPDSPLPSTSTGRLRPPNSARPAWAAVAALSLSLMMLQGCAQAQNPEQTVVQAAAGLAPAGSSPRPLGSILGEAPAPAVSIRPAPTRETPAQSRAPSGAHLSASSQANPLPDRALPERGSQPTGHYGSRQDVLDWLQDAIASNPGLAPQRDAILAALDEANYSATAARLMIPAPKGSRQRDWQAYQRRIVDPVRIRSGQRFMAENAQWLRRAQQQYGVEPAIVASIIGVETLYGRITGNFRVLDALTTLAFDFPDGRSDRRPFFRNELVAFFVWTLRENTPPDSVLGSYAGAIGLGQFMPSSILRDAVDFDGDGHIDLRGSVADAIGSVAHYFKNRGWTPGEPPTFDVTPPDDPQALATLLAPDIVPTFSAADLQRLGATLEPAAQAWPGKLALVELPNADRPSSYVAGTPNFYAITRYNNSSFYAQSVVDLAHELGL
ncbi:lytic murein transglycosylase B [Amphibiibacter pelophylacis]|uniref:Lytic murein transglycosylase B n=1 Tax=Amphibiibacter pelophylacis TaxID=1799477 RepID=A0ACC6P0C0_9BURK